MVSDLEPRNGNVLIERMAQLRYDMGRIEKGVERLEESFGAATTKQGERIGVVEDGLIELRHDFKWAFRFALAIWAIIQVAVTIAMHEWRV